MGVQCIVEQSARIGSVQENCIDLLAQPPKPPQDGTGSSVSVEAIKPSELPDARLNKVHAFMSQGVAGAGPFCCTGRGATR